MRNEREVEAVLMDYIERYGLTEKARAYFVGKDDGADRKATTTK